MEIVIQRYNPEVDKKPYLQSFNLNPKELDGIMLLDALEFLKTKDPSLSFRRSCGGGVCGSDGMNINGKNGLACVTQISHLPDKVVLRPLPSMPIVRDLIVDLTQFYNQYNSVKPWLVGDNSSNIENIQSIDERKKLDGLYECILCACCTTSCPSYWWNPDKFAGPAALLWACRFIVDSRDTTKEDRLKALEGLYALYRCRSIMNCTNSCPKGLDPAGAIADIRREVISGEG
jgi:succinate dehydrogenase / fumarate reductase iron-sulfur subunit